MGWSSRVILFLVSAAFVSGCGKFDKMENLSNSLKQPGVEDPNPVPDPNPEPQKPLDICSKLDFENVTWSARFGRMDRNAFALALNISGSYEGHSGWSNLTNNFDGQGISMGLLNQTLGTGSLQPLLYKFRKSARQSYEAVVPSSLRADLNKMLDQWAKDKGIASNIAAITPLSFFALEQVGEKAERELAPAIGDVDKIYADHISDFQVNGVAERNSVQWALANVYTSSTGRTFKSAWKSALKAITAHPDYISLQIEAAEHLHDRALRYSERLGFSELRAYLMLFDIAVQNGSLAQKHFDQYFAWVRSNPRASEQEAQLKLIDIRAASSKPQYQDDVKRRKRTIVLGTGKVHGANRNMPQEYCYDPLVAYPLETELP